MPGRERIWSESSRVSALRDLAALFSVPAASGDREPAAVVEGLADALVGLSDIESAFVRLRDPAGTAAAETRRGDARPAVTEWLDDRLEPSGETLRREARDLGGDEAPCRGLLIPIGVDAEGGLVAVVSGRTDFPTEVDLLLLSMSANHAATAFQNACLIHDRKSAEEDLRQARDELAREQAALREIANLVARESSPGQLLAVVAEQVARLFDVPLVRLLRYEPDGSEVELIGGWGESVDPLATGTRWRLAETAALASIWKSGEPARLDDYTAVGRRAAAVVRQAGMRSVVACPINVEGRLWGAIAVLSPRPDPLPADTEARLSHFTELVAAAVANAEARRELERFAAEQEALRRAAILVASAASPAEIFAAITTSTSELFEVPFASLLRYGADGRATMVAGCAACSGFVGQAWTVPAADPGIVRKVVSSRRPARVDDHSGVHGPLGQAASSLGIGSVVGAPVIVDGEVWGVLAVGAARDGPPLPADAGDRLVGFTELVTTTLMNAEAREEVRSLVDEQETLRRVAMLVAQGATPDSVFAAVCDEAVALFGVEQAAVVRVEDESSTLVVVGLSAATVDLSANMQGITIGMRSGFGEWPTTTAAIRSVRVARRDVTARQTSGTGPVPDLIRAAGFLSTLSAPISVDGRVWGAMVVSDSRRVLPGDMERRIVNFTDLIATAIANREARDRVVRSEARARQLASEQAALRRVATLAARESPAVEVLEAVAEEAARVLAVDAIGMIRFEPDETATLVAQSETPWDPPPLGTPFTLDGENVVTRVYRTLRVARMDDWENATGSVAGLATVLGITSAVASPIVVEGRLWGTMIAATNRSEPLPRDTESHIVEFAELLATAISNAESRAALAESEARARDLATVQAALRRVATLVAQGASPDELFSAVAAEVAGIIGIPVVAVNRYEADGTFTILGIAGEAHFTVGSRWPIETAGIAGVILATGQPSRWDDYSTMPGRLGDTVREDLLGSTVGVPIVVEGRTWGFLVAAAKTGTPIPADTEVQLFRFTKLVATAVSNASTRSELLSSRARLVSTADETRRRLERDLHDGIQQWLVALALRTRKAASVSATGESLGEELSGLADELVAVTDELREISRGIHPAILSDAGLDDALASLARRSAIRVDLDVAFEHRYDPTLEATVYYVVAESVTNAVKHAQASIVAVGGGLRGEAIEFEITDDGVGGADPHRGTGLIGLKDRVDTLGGTLSIVSPPGVGTTIQVSLPATRGGGETFPFRGSDAVSAAPSG